VSSLPRIKRLIHEGSKFLTVGGIAYIVDVGIFNLLRFAGDVAPLASKPLTAKVISTVIATLVSYLGNKTWTYGHRQGRNWKHELLIFGAFNAVAMLLAVGCLWISHYVLGFTSPLADNISANVIGIGLGTIFRFFTYRKWVFIK
jgi:putative flippase GtrA